MWASFPIRSMILTCRKGHWSHVWRDGIECTFADCGESMTRQSISLSENMDNYSSSRKTLGKNDTAGLQCTIHSKADRLSTIWRHWRAEPERQASSINSRSLWSYWASHHSIGGFPCFWNDCTWRTLTRDDQGRRYASKVLDTTATTATSVPWSVENDDERWGVG
jgi:hypothetical protein